MANQSSKVNDNEIYNHSDNYFLNFLPISISQDYNYLIQSVESSDVSYKSRQKREYQRISSQRSSNIQSHNGTKEVRISTPMKSSKQIFSSIRQQYDHNKGSYSNQSILKGSSNMNTNNNPKDIKFSSSRILYESENYESGRSRSLSTPTLKSCLTESTEPSTDHNSSAITDRSDCSFLDDNFSSEKPFGISPHNEIDENNRSPIPSTLHYEQLHDDDNRIANSASILTGPMTLETTIEINPKIAAAAAAAAAATTTRKVEANIQDESSQSSPNTTSTSNSYSEYYVRRRQQSDAIYMSSTTATCRNEADNAVNAFSTSNNCSTNQILIDCSNEGKIDRNFYRLQQYNGDIFDTTYDFRKFIIVTMIFYGVIYLATNFNLQSCGSVHSFLRQPMMTGSLRDTVTLSSRRSSKHSLGDLVSSLDTRLVSVEGSEWLDEDEYSMMSLPQYKLSQSTLQTDYVQFVKTWNVTPRYSLNKCYSTHSSDINDMRMGHYIKSTSFGFVPTFSELSLSPEDMKTCLLKASRMNGHSLSVTMETDTHKQIVVLLFRYTKTYGSIDG